MSSGSSDLAKRVERLLAVSSESPEGSVERVLAEPWDVLFHVATGKPGVRKKYALDLEDGAATEDRVRGDYTGRYPIELLQNAHDACSDAGVVGQAWIEVTETALLVGNQGLAFDTPRVRSLLRLGGSSKDRAADGEVQHHTIGYKGIGFSSVFEVTDTPQVISQGAEFGFHRSAALSAAQHALGLDIGKVPIRRFPFVLSPDDWRVDRGAVERMRSEGAVTVIRLPFGDRTDADRVRRDVIATLPPEVLLFMPSLDGLSIRAEHTESWKRTERKQGTDRIMLLSGPEPREWLIRSAELPLDRDLTVALDDVLWEGVSKVRCSVGLPWRGRKPDPDRGPQPVACYFPTDDQLGHSLLIHGDFYVDSSRRHVQRSGARGAVSQLVADAAVALVVDLAADMAAHGNALLRCLARTGEPDGFGRDLSQKVNAALASTSFCRTAQGERAAAPSGLLRVGTRLSAKDAGQVAAMLSPSDDLLHFGDDEGVEHWMGELGCATLGPTQVAARLSPEVSQLSYRQAVEVIAAWFDTAGRAQLKTLRDRRIVQDLDGQWCRPIDVVVADPDAPRLPKAIRPLHLGLPKGQVASEFILDELGIEELDEGSALQRLLEAVDAEEFGRNAKERVEVLEYLRKLLKRAPRIMADERSRLAGVISVPVRSADRESEEEWRPAGHAYFGASDIAGCVTEEIYGPLGQPEFLDLDRLPVKKDWVPLFKAVGVAAEPRTVSLPGNARWSDWRRELVESGLLTCPGGHTGSTMMMQGLATDRLQELIDHADLTSLTALAEFLAGVPEPFGDECTVKCSHGAHKREQPKKIPGYQSWVLRNCPWIPSRDATGEVLLRLPSDAWYQIEGSPLAAVVPRALVSDAVASVLGLVSGDAPSAGAIEGVLEDQAAQHLALEKADDAVRGALSLLLQQLEGAVTKGETASRVAPPFPCSNAGNPCWSSLPIDLDLLETQQLPVDALPPGDWRGIRGTYGIPRLSEVAQIDVRKEPAIGAASGILTAASRAHLVALLARRGQDMREAARRVGLIEEEICDRLQLRISLDQTPSVTVQRAHYIRPSSSGSGAAKLYLSSRRTSRDELDLSADLADAVGAAHLTDLVSTYLGYGDAVLEREGVTEEMVEQASAALARYPHAPSPEAPQLGGTEESVGDAASNSGHGASSEGSPSPRSRAVAPETDSAEKSDPAPGSPDHSADDLSWSEPWPEEADVRDRGNGGGSAAKGQSKRGRSKGNALEPLEVSAEVDVERVVFGRAADGPQQTVPSSAQSRRTSARTGHDSPRVNEAERTVTEHDAMAVVQRFVEKELGGIVHRVEHLNLGWDLEATVAGNEWYIEVKGFAGDSNGFVITKNERTAAYAEEGFRVAVVTGLASGEGRISLLERVGTNLERAVRVPMSWSIDDWKTWPDQISYPWREK